MKRNHITLATLGDNNGYLTCSMYVAYHKLRRYSISPYSSFEDAINALKKGNVSLVLVPSAYSLINNFIMDNEIYVKKTFIEKIPPLVLVAKIDAQEMLNKKSEVIYLHEATTSVLDEIKFDKKILIHKVGSNIEACKCLLNDKNIYNCAITNLICADYFNLQIIKELRADIRMPWVVFEKKL